MKIKGIQLMLWLAASLLAPIGPAAIAADTGFLQREIRVEGESYKYQVYVPAAWTPQRKWPVILFLHGAGERGADGFRQTRVGLPAHIRTREIPAVVVMPQCRRGKWWGESDMEAQAFGALDRTMSEFNGDPDRLYLTGLSMGGYGVWAFGYKFPKRFAALAPVCGGVRGRGYFRVPDWHPSSRSPQEPYSEAARGIGRTPVWAFHGEIDRVVPVSESRNMVRALRNSGGDVRYSEYKGVSHNSWDRAYSDREFLDWLLTQRLSER